MRPAQSNFRSQRLKVRSGSVQAQGFTLVEAVIVLGIFAFLMIVMTSQLIEGASLSFKTSRTLEYARSSRQIIGWLAADTHSAQTLTIYPSFDDRSTTAGDGESGNYLVLQEIDPTGVVTRTIGYYVAPADSAAGWTLFRHDSADGSLAAGTLPAADTMGAHRRFIRSLRLPETSTLFRNIRDRSFSIRGEFGTADNAPTARLELVQCALTTRS